MIPTLNTNQIFGNRARVAEGRRLRWFFPGLSGVLLAVLVVGFAPSFFLRGRISTPSPLLPIPPYLILHGIALTTWYALVLAQTCLVAAGRTDLHRRLGVAGLGVAILIVPISALVVVRAVPRLLPVALGAKLCPSSFPATLLHWPCFAFSLVWPATHATTEATFISGA